MLPCSFHPRDCPGDIMICQLAQWPHHWLIVLNLNRFLLDAFMCLPCPSGERKLSSPSPSPSPKRFSISCCCVFQSLSCGQLKFMSAESVMPSNHLVLCHPLLLWPSILPSIRVFLNGLVLCIRWLKYCRLSFSNSPSNEYSGLISFRID